MTRLDFKEAAGMARKLVEACIAVKRYPYVKDIVFAAFEATIKSARRANEVADTETDNFHDGFRILQEAVRVAGVWMEFWSDVHHNGRPSRWLKVTDHLALQGKAESLLVLKENSDLFRKIHKDPDAAHEEIWELHQRDRAQDMTKSVDDVIYQGVKEHFLPGDQPERRQWQVTSFSLQVRSGRIVENLGRGPQRLDSAFYAFVFPGLEVLGYETPVLYL
jgi:hypothetical protein